MPGVFPDYPAPVIRNAGDAEEMVMMRWGMPPPSKRDPRTPADESGHSSYGAADINCDAVGIG